MTLPSHWYRKSSSSGRRPTGLSSPCCLLSTATLDFLELSRSVLNTLAHRQNTSVFPSSLRFGVVLIYFPPDVKNSAEVWFGPVLTSSSNIGVVSCRPTIKHLQLQLKASWPVSALQSKSNPTSHLTSPVMLVIRTYALYDRSKQILAVLIITHVGGAVGCLVRDFIRLMAAS